MHTVTKYYTLINLLQMVAVLLLALYLHVGFGGAPDRVCGLSPF